MQLSWLREHRPLVEALFQWGNFYARSYRVKYRITEEVTLSASEIQVIEYLLENEELQLNMAAVARRLGVSPVTFNDVAARLVGMGLLGRYRQHDNHKNTILLVTPDGRSVYEEYSRNLQERWEGSFMKILDEIPEEYRETFCRALNSLVEDGSPARDSRGALYPIDPESGVGNGLVPEKKANK